jgi:hypothetical protein
VFIGDVVGGEAEHRDDTLGVAGGEAQPVQAQERLEGDVGRALVAVNEGMIAGDIDRVRAASSAMSGSE